MSGIAIIIPNVDFSATGLGKVTKVSGGDVPSQDVPLQSLTINGPSSVNTASNTAQFSVTYNPTNTTQTGVIWSISNGASYAEIDTNGLLRVKAGATSSSVTVRAVSRGGNVKAEKTITVSYYQTAAGSDITSIELTKYNGVERMHNVNDNTGLRAKTTPSNPTDVVMFDYPQELRNYCTVSSNNSTAGTGLIAFVVKTVPPTDKTFTITAYAAKDPTVKATYELTIYAEAETGVTDITSIYAYTSGSLTSVGDQASVSATKTPTSATDTIKFDYPTELADYCTISGVSNYGPSFGINLTLKKAVTEDKTFTITAYASKDHSVQATITLTLKKFVAKQWDEREIGTINGREVVAIKGISGWYDKLNDRSDMQYTININTNRILFAYKAASDEERKAVRDNCSALKSNERPLSKAEIEGLDVYPIIFDESTIGKTITFDLSGINITGLYAGGSTRTLKNGVNDLSTVDKSNIQDPGWMSSKVSSIKISEDSFPGGSERILYIPAVKIGDNQSISDEQFEQIVAGAKITLS